MASAAVAASNNSSVSAASNSATATANGTAIDIPPLSAKTSGTGQPSNSKQLDESLWWDSFVVLLEDLDSAPLTNDLAGDLVEKVSRNHAWLLHSVSCFKPPSEVSELALDCNEISLGNHSLVIKPKLKEAAVRASKCLCLDEVQTYILVSRSVEHDSSVADLDGPEFLHMILLQYFIERQCLLKCIRRIFAHALCMSSMPHSTSAIKREALQLVHDGLDMKILSTLKDLLSSVSSGKFDVELLTLWVDEIVIEDNLILDILFIVYYDNFSICNSMQWANLCSLFKDFICDVYSIEKLFASVEARASFCHAKVQLLLVIIEALDLENVLHLVHEEVPFRQSGSVFSMHDVHEMDSIVSSFSGLGSREASPLFLAWAVFICLLSSLPDAKNNNFLVEIHHVNYVRLAFEGATLNYLLDVLLSDKLRDSDGPVSGFLSVLRTLMSGFIASYELSHQPEGNMLSLVLEILCQIYCGEESLSVQFWDRESFIDGPIRSLLYMLESEYPYRINEFVGLLSALCSGSWSAECVYNFLNKMPGLTLLYENPSPCLKVVFDMVEAHNTIPVPGIEGIAISPGTRGQILKSIDKNTTLVRWECEHSGVFLLLLRMAQMSHSINHGDILLILNLLYKLVSSNVSVCFNLISLDDSYTQEPRNSGLADKHVRIDVVRVISFLAVHLTEDGRHARAVGICISILAEMLKCAPSHVIDSVLSSNIIGPTNVVSSSDAWLFSGELSRMLLADYGEESDCFLLTTSVLELTIELIEKGTMDTSVCAIVVFLLQYIFVNHVLNYKLKHGRWKVTTKVLDLMKRCVKRGQVYHKIQHILLYDSSIHNSLCQLLCVSRQALEENHGHHLYELKRTESLQDAVSSALEILYYLLADHLKGSNLAASPFMQTLLSSSGRPIAVFSAIVSLMNFFPNPAVQIAAAKVLSMICALASRLQPYSLQNISADPQQINGLSSIIRRILDEGKRKDLLISVLELLASAASFQPSFLLPITSAHLEDGGSTSTIGDVKNQLAPEPGVYPSFSGKGSVVDSILKYVKTSKLLMNSDPRLLMSIFSFLKALWDGGDQYMELLVKFRKSSGFWEHLSSILMYNENFERPIKIGRDDDIQLVTYRICCQGVVLEIIARETFLQEKVLPNESSENLSSTTNGHVKNRLAIEASSSSTSLPNDILSNWYQGSTIDALIKSYSPGGYDTKIINHAKMAACVLIVHLMSILRSGSTGCLSMLLVEKIHMIHDKLIKNSAFSELLTQYSYRGYSDGEKAIRLVLHDLYYHLNGELEGRGISSGPFQELSQFLLDLETFQCDENNCAKDLWSNDVPMYDIASLRRELGIDLWDMSGWKTSKEIAETMLSHMHAANLMISLTDSKNFALKALVAVISLTNRKAVVSKSSQASGGIPESFLDHSIRYVCRCMQSTEDSFVQILNPQKKLLELLTAQAEILLVLSRILFSQESLRNSKKLLPVSIVLIRTSGSCFKLLSDVRPSATLKRAVKLLLMLLLVSMESCYCYAYTNDNSDLDVNQVAEASLAVTGQLPILCKYMQKTEYFDLSVASMDIMLKSFSTPSTWLPVLQENLHIHNLVHIICQPSSLVSVSITLNFCLTLARTKYGAEMLHSVGIFPALKILFNNLAHSDNNIDELCSTSNYNNDEKHVVLLELGLAIITSVVFYFDDDSTVTNIFDSAVCNFFSEKSSFVFSCLSAPNFPFDDQNKQRARNHHSHTSLTALSLAEQSLSLICMLSRHPDYPRNGMKEMDLKLRQKIIHLLAFISREAQRVGDMSSSTIPFFCLPTLKEEAELNEMPSVISCKHGWFMVSAFGMSSKIKGSSITKPEMSLVPKDHSNRNTLAQPTRFSDIVAIQVYRIAFLVLTFLCMQAKVATERAEEVGFVDLDHFPDLPMPDILHGLQDQAIAIVRSVCEADSSSFIQVDAEVVCLLLLQILEKSLYLEFCVTQSCGIRPVLGRVEDFSREIKLLIQGVDKYKNLKASLASLRKIITLVYPGLLQTSSFV